MPDLQVIDVVLILIIVRLNNRGASNVIFNRAGQVSKIGNVRITYNRKGDVTRVGVINIKYDQGMVKRIGNLTVKYNRNGRIVNTRGNVMKTSRSQRR